MKENAHQVGLQIITRPKEVEASLWRRYRFESDGACRETLFDRYHRLALIIARQEFRRRPPYGLDRKDFEQLAYGGLLEAIDRFDPLRGAPFSAFARHRIRGAISDGLMQSSEIAAQYSQRRRTEMERMKDLAPGAIHGATDFIAELSDMATLLAIGLIAENDGLSSFGSPSPQGDGYGTVAWREMQISVLNEIDRLPPQEKSVMQQHYFNGVEFKNIARLLGLSKGRVSQLHRSALERIRARLQVSD
jgi:RNA polymerase sigma factor FliA